MKNLRNLAAVILFIFFLSSVLCAQWPSFPTPVPQTADGKPNLEGPTPQTPGGRPDLSGIWQFRGPGAGQGEPSNDPPLATFLNIGAGFKDGLPYTTWAAELHRQREANHAMDNPDAHCLPLGLMQLHTSPSPRKIVQSPKVILILYESGGYRQIYMDGRSLPNSDADSWWYAYSVGRWEGDTLVVESTGFRDDVWLDVNGSPLTSTGKVTERFRRPNYGNLEIEVTVEDPKSYSRPFTVRINHRVMPNNELMEYVCNENEKSSSHYRPDKK